MSLLDGKVVFVTGGGRGQGRAHAVMSARHGADIIVVDTLTPLASVPYPGTTAADIAQTVAEVETLGRRVLFCDADVRDQDAVDAAVSEGIATFGAIDCLIANAGIVTLARLHEMSRETWQEMIDINLTGVWQSMKAVVPHMIGRQHGSIVITSSVNGLEPAPFAAHYAAAKFGLVGLMKSAAVQLGPDGIRVNAVHPGAVLTGMIDNQFMYNLWGGGDNSTRADLLEAGRHYGVLKGSGWLDPDAIADAVLFLNSAMASNITGISLPVDSGHMLMSGVNMDPRD